MAAKKPNPAAEIYEQIAKALLGTLGVPIRAFYQTVGSAWVASAFLIGISIVATIPVNDYFNGETVNEDRRAHARWLDANTEAKLSEVETPAPVNFNVLTVKVVELGIQFSVLAAEDDEALQFTWSLSKSREDGQRDDTDAGVMSHELPSNRTGETIVTFVVPSTAFGSLYGPAANLRFGDVQLARSDGRKRTYAKRGASVFVPDGE